MKRVVLFLAACSSGYVEYPSTTPPEPWGTPITGGTIHVTRDSSRAVIADPDRDRVMIVRLDDGDVLLDHALRAGSEPGRIAEDGAGRLHIALRGAGSLLTLEPSGAVVAQRLACGEPRGVAWEPSTDLVHVACTGGELVSFAPADGDPVRTVFVDRDLRDVVINGDKLVVTRLRSAELLTLDAQGAIVSRSASRDVMRISFEDGPTGDGSGAGSGTPKQIPAKASVAWRTIAMPDGRMVMSHQRKVDRIPKITTGGYSGGGCDSLGGGTDGSGSSGAESGASSSIGGGSPLVESAITVTNPDGTPIAIAPYVKGALPVDVAVDQYATRLAFVSAGTKSVNVIPTQALSKPDDDTCGSSDQSAVRRINDSLGTPTSVAFRANGELVVFYPELPALVIHAVDPAATPRTLTLPGSVGYDSGRDLFHSQTGAGIACASCHPEAREDGQTWVFDPLGARRTQSLAGGILSRGPYHWSGDMTDLTVLMTNVFGQRMLGGAPSNSQLKMLGPWLDRVPAPQPSTLGDDAQIARGQQLFLSAQLGCITCHTGSLYTNNQLVDVGTGGLFKVPSLLGVAGRDPYMHDGCAATLRDRFTTCGNGSLHGNTATLTATQLDDLIAFLESL